jgi:Ribbon-helix-helix protein, copG family.
MATVNLTLRINEDLKKRLENMAQENERSLSFVAGKAIEEYLEKYKPIEKE